MAPAALSCGSYRRILAFAKDELSRDWIGRDNSVTFFNSVPVIGDSATVAT